MASVSSVLRGLSSCEHEFTIGLPLAAHRAYDCAAMHTLIEICPFGPHRANAHVLTDIDTIFFSSSNTKSFQDPAARAAFRERWLGRYLSHDADWCYLAFRPNGDVVGYLAGAIDDPAVAPRFSDIPYFADFKNLTRHYPAHLHVNVAPSHRSGGVGARLITAFLTDLRRSGIGGVHVVTSQGARNVTFYERQGFCELAASPTPKGEVLFLGRSVTDLRL